MYAGDYTDIIVPLRTGRRFTRLVHRLGELDDGSRQYHHQLLQLRRPRYLGGQFKAYKCPGDTMPSDNGDRIRSVSMNSQMGTYYYSSLNYNSGWRTYAKFTELTAPLPARAWIFVGREHVFSQ